MKRFFAACLIVGILQLAGIAWAANGDPVVQGKTATGNITTTGIVEGASVTQGGAAVYSNGGNDVTVSDGGTGASNKTDAFDALSPMTTIGDLIYGGANGTGTRLPAGATTEILVGGSAAAPVWTTATGTGAPARAGSPTFTTQITTPIIDLTGGQVAFPSTQVPSAGVNTLDDYEEGSFETAATMSTSGTVTLDATYRYLTYTKIGRVVTVIGAINVASVSSPVGVLSFSLPFTSANIATAQTGGTIGTYGVNYNAGTYAFGLIQPNTNSLSIKTAGDNIATDNVIPVTADVYYVNITYFAAN